MRRRRQRRSFKGKHILPKEALSIEPPPGDEELKHIVEPAYLYEEKTEIVLEGSTMTVKTQVRKAKLLARKKLIIPDNERRRVSAQREHLRHGGLLRSVCPSMAYKPRYYGNELGAGIGHHLRQRVRPRRIHRIADGRG